MGYLRPTDGRTLCSRDCHRGRNPPSQEAGTDIWAAFGTPLRAPAAGTVVEVGGGTGPATGYFVTIDLDDGRRIRYLHLWDRYVSRGDRVSRGTIFAQSGGSGYGSMTAAGGAGTVGQHVHVTLWPTHSYSFGTNANTLDFEQYADPIGAEAPASTGSQPFNQSEEDDMSILFRITDGQRQGTSYTLEPFRGVKAHLNEFGARVALRARNKGAWPPEGQAFEEYRKDESHGELQMPEAHARALLDVYGLTEVAAASNLPAPGELIRV
ncbi:MAG: family peptidase [Microbacterium sp.]|jgi:murein DD-endopeptidase MepM/ murein hydrolase activator NlpD|nr:family peptidase [Microbacterium sp.]